MPRTVRRVLAAVLAAIAPSAPAASARTADPIVEVAGPPAPVVASARNGCGGDCVSQQFAGIIA